MHHSNERWQIRGWGVRDMATLTTLCISFAIYCKFNSKVQTLLKMKWMNTAKFKLDKENFYSPEFLWILSEMQQYVWMMLWQVLLVSRMSLHTPKEQDEEKEVFCTKICSTWGRAGKLRTWQQENRNESGESFLGLWVFSKVSWVVRLLVGVHF